MKGTFVLRRIYGVGLLAAALSLGALPSAAEGEGDNVEVPVLGTFTYPHFGKADGTPINGAVHGVRRVPGGTAVFYSVATGSDSGEQLRPNMAFEPGVSPYKLAQAARVVVSDPSSKKAYRPLVVEGSGGLVSEFIKLDGSPGDYQIVYAVLPELPASTRTVDLQFEWGVSVTGVPVKDGLLGQEVPSDVVPLGEGWPVLPDEQLILQADPAARTFELLERTSDIEQASETTETAEEVSVTLAADFFFDSAEWTLSKKGIAKVEKIAAEIAERGVSEVVVTGYTDSVPDQNIGNPELSKRRAQTVAKLLEKGAPGVNIKAEGRGEADPVASNSTDEGRAQNRRVTVDYEVNQ